MKRPLIPWDLPPLPNWVIEALGVTVIVCIVVTGLIILCVIWQMIALKRL